LVNLLKGDEAPENGDEDDEELRVGGPKPNDEDDDEDSRIEEV